MHLKNRPYRWYALRSAAGRLWVGLGARLGPMVSSSGPVRSFWCTSSVAGSGPRKSAAKSTSSQSIPSSSSDLESSSTVWSRAGSTCTGCKPFGGWHGIADCCACTVPNSSSSPSSRRPYTLHTPLTTLRLFVSGSASLPPEASPSISRTMSGMPSSSLGALVLRPPRAPWGHSALKVLLVCRWREGGRSDGSQGAGWDEVRHGRLWTAKAHD
jgi:hypothetical protein